MTHDGSEPNAEHESQLEALRQAFRDEPASATEGHASSEEVTALIEGTLAPERARELASTALDDPDLALEIRVAAALRSARERDVAQDKAQGNTEAESAAANSGRYRRWLISSALAAVAAIAVFVIIRPNTPSFTNEGTPAIRGEPTGALQPTSPSAELPRDAFTLEWSGGPQAATYDLYLTTADLDAVYSAFNLEELRHTVPEKALAEQPKGTRLLWRVVATTPTGRRIHSSAFEVIVR